MMGRNLPRIDQRAYLGTDKSVPYKSHASVLTVLLVTNGRTLSYWDGR
ncbi:MAG: hypothetical protein FWG87_14015 [Defluviitaleaceae bacterium]|nr:hypothetical protein [Defluviitaleaceae bacterium]